MTGDSESAPVFQVERLVQSVGDDSALIGEVLASFRATAPGMLSAVTEAFQDGDNEALETAAHRLRGSCLMIGAEALARTCDRLEALVRRRETGEIPTLLNRAGSDLDELIRVISRYGPEPPPIPQ